MTPAQIKNIHIAKSRVGFSEAQYRIMLDNVAGVASSKDLDNASYEDCMAVLEDHGYRQILSGELQAPNYWRRKVATRGTFANGRLQRKIWELWTEYETTALAIQSRAWERLTAEGPDVPKIYELAGLVSNASDGRTSRPEQLTPREAFNLIEMLKAIIARIQTTENTEAAETRRMP